MAALLALPAIDGVEITTIMDNTLDLLMASTPVAKRFPVHRGLFSPQQLRAEHGVSLLITVLNQGKRETLLFDTGVTPDGVLHNLALLLAVGSLAWFARPGPAFAERRVYLVHQTTSAHTFGDFTLIDNPVTSNYPGALLFVTANASPDGVSTGVDTHQIGVWYDSWAGKWGIFNEDQALMPIGPAFNVSIFSNEFQFMHTTTPHILFGFLTEPVGSSSDPATRLLVTQNFNPPGGNGTYNPHPIGVSYDPDSGQWLIYHEDYGAMQQGVSFNVWMPDGGEGITQVATSSNTHRDSFTGYDSTCINDSRANDNPHALVFMTHFQGPTAFLPDTFAVAFAASVGQWCIADTQGGSIPPGATFFVNILA